MKWLPAIIVTGIMAAAPAQCAVRPNMIVIVADDLGWNAVGWHNPEVKTPNLDRLRSEGVTLDRFYVSPMCSPTRAGLMTGRYPIRYGCARSVIPPWRDYGLPVEEQTLAEVLAEAGYAQRGVFGKWHLGHARKRWLPNQQGFTDFLGCYNGAIDYFSHERDGELDWHQNMASLKQDGYATHLIGKAAAEFITEAAKGDAPFLCYVPFNAPHAPFQATKEHLDRYRGIEDKRKQTYFAMISAMDDEIGRILQSLKETGEAENTIVWFFSDNGGVENIEGNNEPLRGAKLTVYEGGVRVPACVRYPAKYPAGRIVTERTAFIDVLPTLVKLAGLNPASAAKPLDGMDLNLLLAGEVESLPERDLYFYHGQGGEDAERIAVICNPWKLVVNGPKITQRPTEPQKAELFDIDADPNEKRDLAEQHPETVERLFAKLVKFRSLQPANALPPYDVGRDGFVAPKQWETTRE